MKCPTWCATTFTVSSFIRRVNASCCTVVRIYAGFKLIYTVNISNTTHRRRTLLTKLFLVGLRVGFWSRFIRLRYSCSCCVATTTNRKTRIDHLPNVLALHCLTNTHNNHEYSDNARGCKAQRTSNLQWNYELRNHRSLAVRGRELFRAGRTHR